MTIKIENMTVELRKGNTMKREKEQKIFRKMNSEFLKPGNTANKQVCISKCAHVIIKTEKRRLDKVNSQGIQQRQGNRWEDLKICHLFNIQKNTTMLLIALKSAIFTENNG